MRVFLDFEASSLSRGSVPIEVAWVFEDGQAESHLIKPAPGWTDWSALAEAVHRIPRALLEAEGAPHDFVAHRMRDVLTGHDLFASSPSWDGRWLSVLLRAAGQPRHALRLRDTDVALKEGIRDVLLPVIPPDLLAATTADIMEQVPVPANAVHRALPDARQEHRRFRDATALALELREAWSG